MQLMPMVANAINVTTPRYFFLLLDPRVDLLFLSKGADSMSTAAMVVVLKLLKKKEREKFEFPRIGFSFKS